MADHAICSVSGCHKPVRVKDKMLCAMHHQRWLRYGDVNAKKIASKGEPWAFYQRALEYDGDDCLLWPYSKFPSGYANMQIDGKTRTVSRMVCEAVNGVPPAPNYDAAHSCGRGHLGCITKRHLSWKTRSENIADMVGHGTARRGVKNPLSKLKEDEVREIHRLRGTDTHESIAAKFGISRTVVTRIYSGDRWGWLKP